jgi:putative transcriptional regulator
MNPFHLIRSRLGLTQLAIAGELGVSQGNVSFYEKGQTVPPHIARKLLACAKKRGLSLSYDHVYGAAKIPKPRDVAVQGA